MKKQFHRYESTFNHFGVKNKIELNLKKIPDSGKLTYKIISEIADFCFFFFFVSIKYEVLIGGIFSFIFHF